MIERKRVDEPTGTETVGHEWDGIEELDTPMPRWWLWTLYATIAWAIGYVIVYPAFPLLDSATEGLWKWSSRGQFEQEMRTESERKRPVMLALSQIPIERLPEDGQLIKSAIQGGSAAFKVNCVQCHGAGAAGSKGYANLNDDDWLWGGDLKSLEYTLEHGIRYTADPQTRQSMMPAFGRDGILASPQINSVASYVLSLSGSGGKATPAGARIFAEQCASCHGPDGRGGRQFGAPNLTDKIWLYGGDAGTIVETLTNGRQGVMPAWQGRLDPVTIKMLAAYVHSLGGGEKFIAQPDSQQQQGDARAQEGQVPDPVKQNASR